MQQGSSPALLSSRVILQGKVRIFTANKRVILVFIVFRGGETLKREVFMTHWLHWNKPYQFLSPIKLSLASGYI